MIPRTFHRIWLDEPVPEPFEAFWRALQALHPDWEFRSWLSSDEVRPLLRHPEVFDGFTDYPAAYALRADVARYELLARFGGVYVDTDIEPLRAFDPLLADDRPFIAWENDQRLCPSVIGAPAGHPALEALVAGLPERVALPGDPSVRTGPVYVTEAWRERTDVRRLPPMAFYPVGWWETGLLGQGAYPAASYAVHHWAKGWLTKRRPVRVAEPVATGAVSFLVPFRDVDGRRTRVWELIRARLQAHYPDAEIVVGTDDGTDPFHKTLAVNRAAAAAAGDVLVLWDADTWVDPRVLAQAIERAASTGEWCRPYSNKLKLSEEATEWVLAQGPDWDGTIDRKVFRRMEGQTAFQHAPPLVFTRAALEAVGGMDERFRGWGQEDLALSLALQRVVGPQRTFAGTALHLWHPRIGRTGNDLWPGQADQADNLALAAAYRRARSAEAMRELIETRTVPA